jgi:hypothetical protein
MSHGEVRAAVKKLERRIEQTNGGFLTDVEVDRDTLRTVLAYANAKMGNMISEFDPEATYEVGERVMIGDDFLENAHQYVGEVGEIIKIEDGGGFPYFVKFEDSEAATCWSIDELRKFSPEA